MSGTKIPPFQVKELRRLIASAISDFKAYDVPKVCVRLGLADGMEQEAYSSKFKYAQTRLTEVNADEVLEIGRQLMTEEANFELAELVAKIDERDEAPVTELTRRRIAAVFDERQLCTELEEIDLIRRVWPINKMQPFYQTEEFNRTLEDDIFQHTIRNDDWSNRELLEAIGFYSCSRAQLFRFLKSVTDPLAQTPEAQAELVERINKHLQHDGYALSVSGRQSGSLIYEVTVIPKGAPADADISAALSAFNPNDVHARWLAAMERRSSDPAGAITLARTLLEDVCKWVLTEAGKTYKDNDDLPVLYRHLSNTLKLAPDAHTEQVFKQILGSCQSIVKSLGALRNKLGDAHSMGPKRARPLSRHAELAVNLAGAMATFLVYTWLARQQERQKSDH